MSQVRGQDKLGLYQAKQQAEDNGPADSPKELAEHAIDGHDGNKGGHCREDPKKYRNGYFAGSHHGGASGVVRELFPGVDPFTDDNGVIDQDAEGQ